jgi:hypothetical protein
MKQKVADKDRVYITKCDNVKRAIKPFLHLLTI